MAQFPALPIWTDAYLGDTRHLTAAQHGAYFLLLITAWRTHDCALPNDDALLSKWASMDRRTWDRNRSVVMAFWELCDDGKWRQCKLINVRKKLADNVNQKTAAGKSSALKRKENGKRLLQRDANEKPTIQNQNQNQIKKEHVEKNLFDVFWENFPRQRRGGREEAKRAYLKAINKTTEENIHAALIKYNASRDVAKGFACGAARWLNDERWGNEPIPADAAIDSKPTYADSLKRAGKAAYDNLVQTEGLRAENSA